MKNKHLLTFKGSGNSFMVFLTLITFLTVPLSCTNSSYPDFVIMHDELIEQIVPVDASIEKIAGDLQFTEGPVWSNDGYLLFSDIPANRVYKWLDGELTVFLEPSGNSNGLTFEPNTNHLVLCEHSGRRVSKLHNSERVTIVDNYMGKRLNSPNDIVYKSEGSFYFTDPPYGIGGDDSEGKEIPFNGIYLYQNDTLVLLDSTFTRPNGIALSPDEKFLYVANSDPKNKYWKKFQILPDGTIDEGQMLHQIEEPKGGGGPDGLKVDKNGNVYCTEHEGVWIFSPEGKHLGTIEFPEVPANCAWGGTDHKTLYVTARKSVYKINLLIEGFVNY